MSTVENLDEITMGERLAKARTEVETYFSKFTGEDFFKKVPKEDRVDTLLEGYSNFKKELDSVEYRVDGDALVSLKFIFENLLSLVSKGVQETTNYITVHDTVTDSKEFLIFTQEQLQYIGELFAKCTFETVEEARDIKKCQDGLLDVFNELFINSKKLQMGAQATQTIENNYKVMDLPKEEEEEVQINEVEESVTEH